MLNNQQVEHIETIMVNGITQVPMRTFRMPLELATDPDNPPAVQIWTAKTGRFGSRPVQKPNPLILDGPYPDPYPSTRKFCLVWLDPLVPFSSSAFRVLHFWSHSDMLLVIV